MMHSAEKILGAISSSLQNIFSKIKRCLFFVRTENRHCKAKRISNQWDYRILVTLLNASSPKILKYIFWAIAEAFLALICDSRYCFRLRRSVIRLIFILTRLCNLNGTANTCNLLVLIDFSNRLSKIRREQTQSASGETVAIRRNQGTVPACALLPKWQS